MSPIRFGTRIDLQNNEALNLIFQKVNGLPTPTVGLTGGARFNTADGRFYVCNGSAWILHATNSDALQSFSPAQLRDRATHTGSQTAASISDFNTAVRTNRLDQMAAPTASVSAGSQKITNLANGTANTDAVNFQQLQAVQDMATNAAAGIAIKRPVRVAATTNVTLSGLQTIDGVVLAANDRVLLPNQTDGTQNGIYTAASGAWARATDADVNGELLPGTQVFVTEGTVNADTAWVIISDAAITIGSTVQGWAVVPGSAGSSYTWGNGLQDASGTISVKPGVGITVASGNVDIDTTVVVRKNVGLVPAGTSPIVINHGLNTSDICGLQVREMATGDLVLIGATVTGVNTLSLDFATNPVSNQYRYAITG